MPPRVANPMRFSGKCCVWMSHTLSPAITALMLLFCTFLHQASTPLAPSCSYHGAVTDAWEL